MRDGLVDNARHQRADGQAQLYRADEEAAQGGGGDLGLVRGHYVLDEADGDVHEKAADDELCFCEGSGLNWEMPSQQVLDTLFRHH